MKSLQILLICISLFIVINAEDIDFEAAFQIYVESYNKHYTDGQFKDAFNAFKDNLIKIQKANENWSGSLVNIDTGSPSANMRTLEAAEPIITFPTENYPLMELNQFSDLTFEEFSSTYTGVDASLAPEAAAAAGLSTAAIVGIAVGGGAALAAATGVTIAVVKRRKSETEESTPPPSEVQAKRQSRGIDIFKFRRSKHQSITGRAIPMDKQ